MERGSEVDHEAILGSSVDWTSDGAWRLLIREGEHLQSHWVLDELVHETQIVVPRLKHLRVDLFRNGRVIQSVGLDRQGRKR